MKQLTTKLERFRADHNITPKQLIEASGLSERTVALIRKGSNTTLDSMKAIALGVSKLLGHEIGVDELFDLSTSKAKRSAA
jgi:hypothetical protein